MPALFPAVAAFALAAVVAVAGGQRPVLVVLGEDWSVPSTPENEGIYSNGRVWAQVVADVLQVELNSGAFGRSTTDNDVVPATPDIGSTALPRDLRTQAAVTFADDSRKDVLAVFAGANDLVFNPETSAAGAARRIVDVVANLEGFIAGNLPVLFFELPPLQLFPCVANDPDMRNRAGEWTQLFNNALHEEATALALGERGAGAELLRAARATEIAPSVPFCSPVQIFPTYQLFARVLSTFQVTDRPCLDPTTMQPCPNPGDHLFWDPYHFTTTFHEVMGEAVALQLRDFVPDY